MPRQPEPEPKTMPLSLRLRPSVRALLVREAELQRRSLTNLLETILEDYVEERLTDEQQTWDGFWQQLHRETTERGVSNLTPADLVAEVQAHRRDKRREKKRSELG